MPADRAALRELRNEKNQGLSGERMAGGKGEESG